MVFPSSCDLQIAAQAPLTGKAAAGMIAHAREGRLTAEDTVVFVHTGGVPALFAYAEGLTD